MTQNKTVTRTSHPDDIEQYDDPQGDGATLIEQAEGFLQAAEEASEDCDHVEDAAAELDRRRNTSGQ
jgi:hypothetical protein